MKQTKFINQILFTTNKITDEKSTFIEITEGFETTLFGNENNNDNNDIIINQKPDEKSTFIEISPEIREILIKKYNLNQNEKIIVIIEDSISDEENMAISDYNYKFMLENGTELDLNNIEEDIFININVPILNLESVNFNYNIIFSQQGFDIYDKKSEFYTDKCISINLNGNDITLDDRKNEIYPNNVTLCKDNCEYVGVNIETQYINCSCNLNPNKKMNNSDDFLKQDNGNYFSYILDNINYKIVKCYNLLSSFDNIKSNYSFYVMQVIFISILFLDFRYYNNTIKQLKLIIFHVSPLMKKMQQKKYNPKIKSEKQKIRPKMKIFRSKQKKKDTKVKYIYENTPQSFNNFHQGVKGKKINITKSTLNELPFDSAQLKDKRNICQIFYSIIIQKLEIINILFCSNSKFKLILISQNILSLLINFFFNTLLYSDDVISNKYHNNGSLDYIATLSLSLLSNIITSIITHYLNYAKHLEETFEYIKEIKIRFFYFFNFFKFFKILKIKFFLFLINQIFVASCCFYYIIIFFILYTCTISSLMISYLTSLLESFITSIVITIIITFLRKISFTCSNRNIYNTSKYINEKF